MKLAIVIPWFGRELKGGAEQQAWQIATRLAARQHSVEVLTTCCRSHQDDWSMNHLAEGTTSEPESFIIRRFPVDARDRVAFDRACGALLQLDSSELRPGVPPVSREESRLFTEELIKSAALLNFLEANRTTYDSVLLLPYLYGPILQGVALLRDGATLQPCLHDEAYAYLPGVADAFRAAGKLLFNSEGELHLALRLFGPGIWRKSAVVGEGVEVEARHSGSSRNGASPSQPQRRYVLYLGRREEGKNVPMLVRAFLRFRAVRPNSHLKLVLAGSGSLDLPDNAEPFIEDLGLVDERTKERLLHDCRALFQPSRNESFSRAMMEAWMHGRPVAVNSGCMATAVAVQNSGGGWLAGAESEWAQMFVDVDRLTDAELAQVGRLGRAYAEEFADWDKVMIRYEETLAPTRRSRRTMSAKGRLPLPAEIHQFLPNLSFGDAISHHALWIRDTLRDLGVSSEIFARYIDPRMAHECRVFSHEAVEDSRAIIYHHSVGSEITPRLLRFDGPKCLIYHNITPAEFFLPYHPEFAALLQRGRDDLKTLAPHFALSYGVSGYNTAELSEAGFSRPGVLPISIDPDKWNIPPDAEIMQALGDGRPNLLFVGRIAPNKKQDDLLRAFAHYRAFDPDARLVLVGKAEEADPYAQYVYDLVEALDLQDSVLMPDNVTEATLASYYRTAHLFWCMSEHEGFCVPLVEAMWFDVPVFAFSSSAVPETLGEGSLLFNNKSDLHQLAAAAHLLVKDKELRNSVFKYQRARRKLYTPDKVRGAVERLADDLLAENSLHRRGLCK